MVTIKKENGQTVLETALMIMLLFILFFGIAEVARAWWLKNSLNNAARVGVRVAIVNPGITNEDVYTKRTLNWNLSTNCEALTGNNRIRCTIWNTAIPISVAEPPNKQPEAMISVSVNGGSSPTVLDSGDTITVTVRATFYTVFPSLSLISRGLIPDSIMITGKSAMRYE